MGVHRYREAMIRWGEAKREQDPGFFPRLATQHARGKLWIVTDCRRPTDLAYFQVNNPLVPS
jgi:phosphomevalonate kinase